MIDNPVCSSGLIYEIDTELARFFFHVSLFTSAVSGHDSFYGPLEKRGRGPIHELNTTPPSHINETVSVQTGFDPLVRERGVEKIKQKWISWPYLLAGCETS